MLCNIYIFEDIYPNTQMWLQGFLKEKTCQVNKKNKKNQKKIWLLCCNSLTFRSCSIELFFCFPWKTTARYLQSFPIWVDRWVFPRFRLAWVGFPNPAKTREVPNLNLGSFMCGSELPCPLGSTITVTWQWKKKDKQSPLNDPPGCFSRSIKEKDIHFL